MQRKGKITVRGIVQGVGFRPFVYAQAHALKITGTVKNLGSEVEIFAEGDRFDEFLAAVSRGPPLSRIDSVEVSETTRTIAPGFSILPSGTGSLTGMIPPDIAICDQCHSRYLPARRTLRKLLGDFLRELRSPVQHHPGTPVRPGADLDGRLPDVPGTARASTAIPVPAATMPRRSRAATAGPGSNSSTISATGSICHDPIEEAAELLDAGMILAMRGIGGFHLACVEESADELKHRLGRIEQPFAVMVRPDHLDELACWTEEERLALESPVHPIVVLDKREPSAHASISNLHTIGCMLPYTGLHYLLFQPPEAPAPDHDERQHARLPDDHRHRQGDGEAEPGRRLLPNPQPDHREPVR